MPSPSLTEAQASYLKSFNPTYNQAKDFPGKVALELEYWVTPMYRVDSFSPVYDREDFTNSIFWSYIGRAMWQHKRIN